MLVSVKHLLITSVFAIAFTGALAAVIDSQNFVINRTPSMPGSLYQQIADNSDIKVGDIVLVCPTLEQMKPVINLPAVVMQGHGDCHGMVPLLKLVVAQAGDEVVVSSQHVKVNSNYVINSAQFDLQSLKPVQIETKRMQLSENEYMVAGVGSQYSYDSRYFGPVKKENIIAKLRELL